MRDDDPDGEVPCSFHAAADHSQMGLAPALVLLLDRITSGDYSSLPLWQVSRDERGRIFAAEKWKCGPPQAEKWKFPPLPIAIPGRPKVLILPPKMEIRLLTTVQGLRACTKVK